MLVTKIALTGGPCGGKSTALATIERTLTEMGYKVFVIDEVATRIIQAGIKPFGDDSIDLMSFENIMLKHQLMEEKCFEEVAKKLDKRCVILCDRGVFDIQSFLTRKEFDDLLKANGESRLSLMDSYGMVIHLNTVAKGAESYYTTENNKSRSEGLEEARLRDDKAQEAWSFHNNLRIIDNSINFQDKIDRIIGFIKLNFGVEHRKTEKYIVSYKEKTKQVLKDKQAVSIYIEQTYLNNDKDCEMRLRKRNLGDESTYYITAKRSYKGQESIIVEDIINKKTYERLLEQRKVIGKLRKIRTCVVLEEHLYKLDEFEDGTMILEMDDKAPIPDFVNIVKNVTKDPSYKNINISINNKKESVMCKKLK